MVQGSGFRIEPISLRLDSSGFRLKGLGFKGLGFRDYLGLGLGLGLKGLGFKGFRVLRFMASDRLRCGFPALVLDIQSHNPKRPKAVKLGFQTA